MGLSSFVRSHYFSIEIVNAHSKVAESKAGKRILGVVVLLYGYDVFWAVRGDDSNDNDIKYQWGRRKAAAIHLELWSDHELLELIHFHLPLRPKHKRNMPKFLGNGET